MIILSYLRSLAMALLYLPFLFTISTACFVQNLFFKEKKYDSWFVKKWAELSLAFFGVDVQVFGIENIPQDKGAVFLFNHSSFFDVFALAAAIPDLRFGAKIELFKIPFFGFAMKRVGMLPIDRARRENVFKVYEEARSRIIQGERFALAPEGGRHIGKSLQPFKSGPFIFAIQGQAWVVPVTIKGAADILPKGHFIPNKTKWRTTLQVHILPAVDAGQFSIDQRSLVQSQVYEIMNADLKLPT